jgi:hypothetical protein
MVPVPTRETSAAPRGLRSPASALLGARPAPLTAIEPRLAVRGLAFRHGEREVLRKVSFGAMFPPTPDHPVFAAVMRANPVAYAVSAARRALGGPLAPGALPGSAAHDLAVVAAFAAAALGLAVLAARRRA